MTKRPLKHLHDEALLRRLTELIANGNRNTAELLVHLAEVEERQLHLRAGYDSMKAYLVGGFHFSEDAARKRVHAMHAGRNFPELFEAIAEGWLHLTAVTVLAPRLNAENVGELIAAAKHRTSAELELELARRFPMAEALRLDDGVSPQVVVPQESDPEPCALKRTVSLQQPPKVPTKIAPITGERYTVQVTIDAETHDTLRQVQQLLGHAVSPGDVSEVLKRSLKVMLVHLRKQKFAQVERPRRPRNSSRARTISAQVKRAVYERDGERCAFVGDQGHRCGSSGPLEYDHIQPVALGGRSTVENVRLVCRTHNQFAADQSFGQNFMDKHRRKDEAALQSPRVRGTARSTPIPAGV